MSLSVVLLPVPDSPTMQIVSPCRAANETSSRIGVSKASETCSSSMTGTARSPARRLRLGACSLGGVVRPARRGSRGGRVGRRSLARCVRRSPRAPARDGPTLGVAAVSSRGRVVVVMARAPRAGSA